MIERIVKDDSYHASAIELIGLLMKKKKHTHMDYLNVHMTAFALIGSRWLLGMLIFFQAYDRIFNVGMPAFNSSVTSGLKSASIPKLFIHGSGYISSYLELICGVLLILGLFLPFVYVALLVNLLMVALSFSFMKPMWEMNTYFPRFILLIFLMSIPFALDVFSLDALFGLNG